MNYQIICGNLGADAEYKCESGHEFVKFNVADSRRWTDAEGKEHDETTWVSCILNGKAENLMPYLKKGQKVLCMGTSSTRVYSSEKFRRMVAGINLRVDRIELVGGSSDEVPKKLATQDGYLFSTMRVYFIDNEARRALQPEKGNGFYAYDERGRSYYVYNNGNVVPVPQEQAPAQSNQNQAPSQQKEQEQQPVNSENITFT